MALKFVKQAKKGISALEKAYAEIEQQGFDRGVAEFAGAMKAALDKVVAQFGVAPTPIAAEKKAAVTVKVARKATRKSKGRTRPNSDQAKVLAAIEQHPGKKGFQILELLGNQGTPVNERTFRTSLNRRKAKGRIKQLAYSWFPAEEKANGQLPLE